MDCIYLAQKYSKPLVSPKDGSFKEGGRRTRGKATADRLALGLVGCRQAGSGLCLYSSGNDRSFHLVSLLSSASSTHPSSSLGSTFFFAYTMRL